MIKMTQKMIENARRDIELACDQGKVITLSNEGSEVELKSFPTRYRPFNRTIREKVSWADDCEVICYTSLKAVEDKGFSVERLRQFNRLKTDGSVFDIAHIERYLNYGDDFLYVLIGGAKK